MPPDVYSWSSAMEAWSTSVGRPVLDSIDLSSIDRETWDVLRTTQEVKHLAFSNPTEVRLRYSSPFPDVLDHLQLESLYLASWSPFSPNLFACLTRSSLSTLRTLRLPWNDFHFPLNLSVFTSLASLVLSKVITLPSSKLVLLLSTLPPTTTTLAFVDGFETTDLELDTIAQSVPTSVLRLHLPGNLRSLRLTRFIDALPVEHSVRLLCMRDECFKSFPCVRPNYEAERARCVEKGIGFKCRFVSNFPTNFRSELNRCPPPM
jgi:hypothetical protein